LDCYNITVHLLVWNKLRVYLPSTKTAGKNNTFFHLSSDSHSVIMNHIWSSKASTHISRPIRRTVIFFKEIFGKNNDDCILILVIYWKKAGLLHTKISNHNIIHSSQKPRKSPSLPLKSSSWLFSLDAGMGIYKFGNNTYPQHIRRRSNIGHIFWGKKCLMVWEIW
jgi:hypothetical protein